MLSTTEILAELSQRPYALSYGEIAERLGVSPKTILTWRQGKAKEHHRLALWALLIEKRAAVEAARRKAGEG